MSGNNITKLIEDQKPIFVEKFDEWKVYWDRCPFAAGQGKSYCRFAGHPCAFLICPMRAFEDSIQMTRLVSDEMQWLRNQIKLQNQQLATLHKKMDQLLKPV